MDLGQVLMVVFTGVVALSTVVYAVLTGRLVAETRTMRESQTEPRVSIRVESDLTGAPGYELVIRNEGQGVARKISFEFEGDPSYFRSSWLTKKPPAVDELPVITGGLDYLEPKQTYRFYLGNVSEGEFARAVGNPWTFRTRYESIQGKRKSDTYVIDFSQFLGTFFEKNYLRELAGHMEGVRNDFHRLTEGHARVQVVTQTREAFEQRREEWRQAQAGHGLSDADEPSTDNNEE